MFKLKVLMFTAIIAILTTGCVQSNYVPTKTGLELQAIQKKEFTTKYKIAFAATLSVFQDKGYIIKSANNDTGFITAESPIVRRTVLLGNIMDNLQATAFIENIRLDKVSIRLNFVNYQNAQASSGAQSSNSVPMEDPIFYKDIFNKIDKAIFIRTSQ
jgi:hypothetical protein